MLAPIIICNGVFRSGSTWSYNVCRELAQRAAKRMGKPFACTYLSSEETEYFMRVRAATIPGPIVIKAHIIDTVAWEWINSGRAKAVITYRDPRDCIASDKKFMGHEFDKCVERILNCFKRLPATHNQPHVLSISYEKMMANPLQQIRPIATHLGIEADYAEIEEINQLTNIEGARKVCQDLKSRTDTQVVEQNDHKVDMSTQLHDNHIDSGKIGRWRDDLTAEQTQELNRVFREWLLGLGYETEASLKAEGR